MHYRNIYVFLANVADEVLNPTFFAELDINYKDN